jgi:predicted lipid-binding transport protein (Tim44 family)
MSIYIVKIKDTGCFNHPANVINKGFKTSLFTFLAAVFTVAAFFIYFKESVYARQAKSVSSSSQAVRSASDYGGGLDFGYGYRDMTEAKKRSFTKTGDSGAVRYKSSYARGYNLSYARLASAIVIFCTFIIISIIGIIHYLNIKSSTKGEYNSASPLSPASYLNLSTVSVRSSVSGPDTSISSVSASSLPAASSGPDGRANPDEAGAHDLYRLYERVKEVFKRVQQSWGERDLSRAEKYMSRRFFYWQQRRMEDITAEGERNIITNVEIIDVKIMEIKSGGDSGAGYMKALVKFSMIDYTIKEPGGSVVRGDEYVPAESSEVWSFVSGDSGWVVDEIAAVA